LRWGLANFLPQLALNHNPPISISQIARVIRHRIVVFIVIFIPDEGGDMRKLFRE
jgi:hypothetical protein